jgi:hypothetical protein
MRIFPRAISFGCLLIALTSTERSPSGATIANAQVFHGWSRYTSPPERTAASIDGKEFSIEYYAPSMHGRKIMGGLVPYGEVWCTGANVATTFTTAADLDMNGLKVPKGSYSIWTIPNEKEWTLILNSETHQFHLDYDSSRDFGRTKMILKTPPAPVETLKIAVASTGPKKGTLAISWENSEASVPFTLR